MATRQARSDGEGSIYPRHEARYGCPAPVDGERPEHDCTAPFTGSLVIGWKEGKPVRKKVSASTRAGVAKELRELREKLTANELPEGRALTVEAWMNYWLEKIAPRGNGKKRPTDSTLETYATNVRQYINPMLGHHKLDRLTPEHINEAWDQLLDDGNPNKPADKRTPLSPNSVHLVHCVLRRALKVAVQRKKLRTSPASAEAMDAPPREEVEVVPIPMDEVKTILAAAADVPGGARWSVALALGLRPAEALGMRWEDVDLEAGVLHVRQQLRRVTGKGLVASTPKSRAGKRSMHLPATLVAALKAHRREQAAARLLAGDQWQDTGLVFTMDDGRGFDAKPDRERWHKLLDLAGVPHRRLYDARHSAATLLLAQGVPLRTVMELLGHSQVAITMRYMHVVDDMKASAAAAIDGALWATGSD